MFWKKQAIIPVFKCVSNRIQSRNTIEFGLEFRTSINADIIIFMDNNKDFETMKFMLTIKIGIYREKRTKTVQHNKRSYKSGLLSSLHK